MVKSTVSSFDGVRSALIASFATLLRSEPSRIDTDVHVLELGADSIMLVEAQRRLEADYGCRIEISQFFQDLNTIDRIARHVAETAPPRSASAVSPPPPPEAPPLPAAGVGAGVDAGTVGPLQALFRAQLSLVADTIEAQNRVLARFAAGAAAPPPSDAAAGATGEVAAG